MNKDYDHEEEARYHSQKINNMDDDHELEDAVPATVSAGRPPARQDGRYDIMPKSKPWSPSCRSASYSEDSDCDAAADEAAERPTDGRM